MAGQIKFLKKLHVNRFYKKLNLGLRIFIMFSFLIILSLTVFSYFAQEKWSNIFSQKSVSYLRQINEQILNNIDRDIYEMQRLTLIPYLDEYLSALLSKENSEDEYSFNEFQFNKAVSSVFFSYIQARQDIFSFRIFDISGKEKLSIYKTDIKSDNNVFGEPWFKTAANSPSNTTLIAHYNSKVSRNNLIAVIRPIYDTNTFKPIGIVNVEQEESQLEKIVHDVKQSSSNTIILLDQDNQIIYSSGNIQSDYLKYVDNTRPYVEFGISGEKFISVTTVSPKTGLKSVNIISFSEFERESAEIIKVMYIIMGGCILFALLFSFIFISSITKPLKKLLSAMKKVQEGNMDTRIDFEREDEIGKLSKGFNNMVTEINDLIKREYKSKILKREAELNALQAQINPHFLYNTLDTLRGIAIFEGAPKAASIASGMSHILRYSLNKGGHIVKLCDELESVKNYINIQNIRFSDKFTLDIDVDPALLATSILRLTLQPIVENSILHGMENRTEPGCIYIKAVKAESSLIVIEVSDNGDGIEPEKLEELKSSLCNTSDEYIPGAGKVGIFNVNERIKHYFGNQYGIEIDSQMSAGTVVKIKLPITYQ